VIHRDIPYCACGRCEPAVLDGPPTMGQLLSGNPGCEFPACAIRGFGCLWGNSQCFGEEMRPAS
jgi:hypothetical protein